MKTIFKTQLKLMQSKYGNSLYFIQLYLFGKSVFYFLLFAVWGMIAWLFIDQEYLTQSVYEQLAIVGSFLCIFFSKKEKQYALIPYITKLTVSKIRSYILIKELFSEFNFILFPLVIPVLLLSKTIESSFKTTIFLLICLWLMGLLLNLLARIIKYFCINHKLFFTTTLSIAFTYSIVLILFYRTATVLSYSNLFDNTYSIIILLTGIVFSIPGYFYVIKQELYQVYERNHLRRESIHDFYSNSRSINIFSKMLLLKYVRCNVFSKFLTQIIFYTIAGVVFFFVFGLKIMGLGIFLNIYTFNMLPFTIYLSSTYFDGLYTKPVSIESLLVSAFYLHIIITFFLFLILFPFIIIFEKQLILLLISLYLFTSGPLALLLLYNILFAQRFDLFPIQSDFTIQQTSTQTVIKIISLSSLTGCVTIIHFLPTIGCYIILLISMIIVMTYPYWISILYKKFMQRKYRIMDNLRKK
jgi:hypothetical protein